MSSNVTIAVDLAKSVFQLVIADAKQKITARRRLSRTQFLRFWQNQAPARVLMDGIVTAVESLAEDGKALASDGGPAEMYRLLVELLWSRGRMALSSAIRWTHYGAPAGRVDE
jgi:hypothetical protein